MRSLDRRVGDVRQATENLLDVIPRFAPLASQEVNDQPDGTSQDLEHTGKRGTDEDGKIS